MAFNVGPLNGAGLIPTPRVPGLGDLPAAPLLPGADPLGVGLDLNAAIPALADVGEDLNIDGVNVMAAVNALEKAGDSRMRAGTIDLWRGDFRHAAEDFQAAALDFEREAALLLRGLTMAVPKADPLGGGAPAPAPAPVAATPAPTTPASTPWTVKERTLTEYNTWSSIGDPHETTGDGLKFDNQLEGKFDLLQSASGDFRVQNEQGPDVSGNWKGATLNHRVAIKDGSDVVTYDGKGDKGVLTINGGTVRLEDLPRTLQGGGRVERTADGIKVTSSKGDVVNVHQRKNYIDLDGKLGPNRKDGEVRGGLGSFDYDKDVDTDLKGRTGDDILGKPGENGAIAKFNETWRAKDDLFPKPTPVASDPIGGGAPPPTSSLPSNAWTVLQTPLKENDGKTFSSVGDPHETSGDGLKWDNMLEGNFDLLRSANGDLVVQNEQGPDRSKRWPGATLNHKVAIKDGNDLVTYDGEGDKGKLVINGKPTELKDLPVTLPGGGRVEKTADGFRVVTSKQDEIAVHQRDHYIDIDGKLGNRLAGEVRGGLGSFDEDRDPGNDLKGRTGDGVMGDPKAKGTIDKFNEEWRTKPADRLFPAPDPIGGGAPLPENDDATLRAAIAALDKAGLAHIRAGQVLLARGDRLGAAREFSAAASVFQQEAELIRKMPAKPRRPRPAPLPVHVARLRRRKLKGFLPALPVLPGRLFAFTLAAPGLLFAPAAPLLFGGGALLRRF